ncbi:MAG: ribonuclease HII [bacterium]|nr:ribonuclease HII [bacterium]
MKSPEYVIGIDEVGRGPLAGPVYVGAVIVPHDFDWALAEGVRDSKKLSPKAREEWYGKLNGLRERGALNFATASSPAEMIDERGIVPSISRALQECLKNLAANPETCEIRLDGSLYAPEHFVNQKTIIHGDDIEPIISMASIVAKVRRDSLMKELAVQFPEYGFDVHKGYGTRRHCAAIQEFGLCKLHRESFCGRLRIGSNAV